MGKIVLDKVLGKNLQDFADNIDKNFSRIEGNGVWRGEKGESYVEQTIGLWKEDTDGSIVILNEPILETLFTESDGGSTAWPVVKAWAAGKRDQFLALQIPKAWSLYPGFPLYYSQPAECFKLFKSDAYDTGADWSGMVAAVGSDDGSYTYKRYDILPRIYLDRATGNYCWMINGVKTGITASINPDQETRNIRLYLIRTDAAGDTKYLVSKESVTAWTDKPDILPRVGDFAWRLETKSITTGGVEKPAQVLEVCIYNGVVWIAATADNNNENFFLTYDDMVMHYVWDSIYGGLGDVYDADMRAVGTKSFQFPTHMDNGTATADTHKITSKSYADGTRSDLFVENPYKGQATGGLPDVKSNIVLSGYDDVYLGTPTMNLEGGVSYADERLVKKSEFDPVSKDVNDIKRRVADLESHVIKTITIDELWLLGKTDTNDGDLYKIDRCYWAKDTSINPNVIYSYWRNESNPTSQAIYSILPYVRYVYLRARHSHDNGDLYWDHKGTGLVYMRHSDNAAGVIYDYMLVDVEFDFPTSHYDDKWLDKWSNTHYINTAYTGKHKSLSYLNALDTYSYSGANETLEESDFEKIGDAVDYTKFGVITWMRDPIYKNECAWDFMMKKTFEMRLYSMDGYEDIIPYFDPIDKTNGRHAGGARLRMYGNKLNVYPLRRTTSDISGFSIPRGDAGDRVTTNAAGIRVYYDDARRSSPNYYPKNPLIVNNTFDSCKSIKINHMIGGGTDETAFAGKGIINNEFKASSIELYSSVFAHNNINNSDIHIGHVSDNKSHVASSNMVRCNIYGSILTTCLSIHDQKISKIDDYFQYNYNNKLISIYNTYGVINDLWMYDCEFNHVRSLSDIFVIRGAESNNNVTVISNVMYTGESYTYSDLAEAGIPCYKGDYTSGTLFYANFIGIDVNRKYDQFITPYEATSSQGTKPAINSRRIVKACYDPAALGDDPITGFNFEGGDGGGPTINDYTNVLYARMVYAKQINESEAESFVHMPMYINNRSNNVIYANIPIVGYGYTKSIEEILKN